MTDYEANRIGDFIDAMAILNNVPEPIVSEIAICEDGSYYAFIDLGKSFGICSAISITELNQKIEEMKMSMRLMKSMLIEANKNQ